ncbi:ATP-binding protein [Chromobacterium haemolyticum]|uniref:ATP-binding protein n=1 Tax=Chromobacterium haemolyticum TaxID=394935 RepID=UPI0024493B09|nr:ATP-binding protein [Chromobacterium haemolyticum]MDH0342223.1 ATP-binding protein [Chromobacterium haemolyticum]
MSLRLRLLLWIGVSLCLLWGGVAAWTLHDLERQMRLTLDRRLAMSAQMVAGLMEQLPAPPPRALPRFDGIGAGIACQIVSVRGEVLARTPGAPDTRAAPAPGYAEQSLRGERWRSYTVVANGLRVTTADRLTERDAMLADIRWAAAVPFIAALAGSLVVLWLGVNRGLRPLERLRRALARRAPEALEPVATQGLPRDVLPLADSLNQLLRRVGEALQRERRLTSDAAHELRTPLTAIKTHLQVARITQGPDAAQALAHAAEGAERLQNTLGQLLMLARLEGAFDWEEGPPAHADEVARLAMRDAEPAPPRRIVCGPLPEAALALPQALAATALRNLLDNALRYSPPDAPVRLEAALNEAGLRFEVRDQGPGLTAAQREQAAQRFWRGRHAGAGSGLGLSIVSAIAGRFGGRLELLAGEEGGLCAALTLPALSSTDEGA